jgi:hypothetical protein
MSFRLVTGSIFVSSAELHPSLFQHFQPVPVAELHWTRRSSAFEVLVRLRWHGGSGGVEDVNGHH